MLPRKKEASAHTPLTLHRKFLMIPSIIMTLEYLRDPCSRYRSHLLLTRNGNEFYEMGGLRMHVPSPLCIVDKAQ